MKAARIFSFVSLDHVHHVLFFIVTSRLARKESVENKLVVLSRVRSEKDSKFSLVVFAVFGDCFTNSIYCLIPNNIFVAVIVISGLEEMKIRSTKSSLSSSPLLSKLTTPLARGTIFFFWQISCLE